MSVASAVSNFLKILFLLLLILVIILAGIYWFDYLNLIDYGRLIEPVEEYLPAFLIRGEEAPESPLLLEREFLDKQEQILEARATELVRYEEQLEERALELQEMDARLEEEAQRLEEMEKVLSQRVRAYDNYMENVRQQAQYLISMPPEAAVERLSELDDLLIIDIFRQIDQLAEETGQLSMVPVYLGMMDPEKAASVQRKMTRVSG